MMDMACVCQIVGPTSLSQSSGVMLAMAFDLRQRLMLGLEAVLRATLVHEVAHCQLALFIGN